MLSAVNGAVTFRFKGNLGGFTTRGAHRVKHLPGAGAVATTVSSVCSEVLAAVHRTVAGWLERNLGRLTTISTYRVEHWAAIRIECYKTSPPFMIKFEVGASICRRST